MNMFWLEGANILLVAVEFVIFLLLANSFFPFRHKAGYNAVCIAVAFAVDYLAMTCAGDFVFLKLALAFLIFVVLSRLLFQAHPVSGIGVSLLCISLLNVVDDLFLLGAAKLGRADMAALLVSPQRYYFMAYSAKIAELFLATIIHQWGKSRFHHRPSTWMDYLRIAVFPLAALLCAVMMLAAFLRYPETAGYLLLCCVVLLLADIAAILLLNRFEDQQQALLNTRTLQQELKLSKENIELLADSYASERKLSHDFNNQLYTLQGLLTRDGVQAASDYLTRLLQTKPGKTLPFSTNRAVADVLLTQKYEAAQKKHIRVTYQPEDLSRLPVPDDALVVLLSNLLDNAMEACEKIEDEAKRELCFKVGVEPESIVLSVENTVAQPVKISNNYIETTKTQRWKHGFGLQNIISIIHSYGGSYAMDCKDGRFYFIIQFALEEIEAE